MKPGNTSNPHPHGTAVEPSPARLRSPVGGDSLFDANAVKQAITTLIEPGSVFEVRAVDAKLGKQYRTGVVSGFSDNADSVITALPSLTKATAVYITMNPVIPDLLARRCNRLDYADKGATTADANIVKRRFLLIDVDPTRPAGISSTDAEKEHAKKLAQAIRDHLTTLGWPSPVVGDSGNGWHLLYRIDVATADDGLVANVLKALAEKFDNDHCKVDQTTFNPSRITKLYGTMACKGDSTPSRPHRMSRLIQIPEVLEVVTTDQLQALAGEVIPAPVTTTLRPPARSGRKGDFDLREWLKRHNIEVKRETKKTDFTVFEVPCPFDASHGEHGEVAVFQQDSGKLGFKCHHNTCAGKGWQEYRQAIEPDAKRRSHGNNGDTPTAYTGDIIVLPGGGVSITECGLELWPKIANTLNMFTRGNNVATVRITDNGTMEIEIVRPAAARSLLEKYGKFHAWRSGSEGEPVLKPAVLAEDMARALLESAEARQYLPPINGLIGCPVMFSDGDIAGPGYHAPSGLVVTGGKMPPTVPLPEAIEALDGLIAEYDFQTPGDKSRAFAMMLTPGLKIGGHIKSNVPTDTREATASQSGKTFGQKANAAIYNERVQIVSQKQGGVGSVDESLATTLIRGRPFIQLDNFRGRLDSANLEALLTAEHSFPVREPHSREVTIDPQRFFIGLTSNGVDVTRDLANRSCIIRIKKRVGYTFKTYPEGDLLEHIRARQSYFLGCVFAIIRGWIAQGRQRTNETRHDFREWCGVLDWIVQNICGQAPLMDGHQAAQERVSNPALTFVRKLALAVVDQNRTGDTLIASELYEIAEGAGVEVPGLREPDEAHGKRQVGIVLGRVFKDTTSIEIDGFTVTREEVEKQREGEGFYKAKTYVFRTTAQAAQDLQCSGKPRCFSKSIKPCAACAENSPPTKPSETANAQPEEAALEIF